MGMRKELERIVIDATLGGQAWSLATNPTLTVALYQGDPGDIGTPTTEVSGHGYIRQPISFTITKTDSETIAVNATEINFPTATSSYVTAITHFGIYANTTLIYTGECIPNEIVDISKHFKIRVGTLTIKLE